MHMMDMKGPGSRRMMLLEAVGGIRKPTGKRNRLIILHAGSGSLGCIAANCPGVPESYLFQKPAADSLHHTS